MSAPALSLRLLPHDTVAVSCGFTPSGDMLMSMGWNHLAKLWDVQTGKELLRVPSDEIGPFSSDGRSVAIRRKHNTVGVSRFAGGEECRPFTFSANAAGSHRACLSPDGRWMASGHRDGLRLWDLATGRETHYAAIREISGLQFVPDGRALVSESADGIVAWPIRLFVDGGTNCVKVGPPKGWKILC